MSLTVKAYLQRCENANPEIRRFTVDHDVTSSYEYLYKKIAQVFPSLGRPERFTTAWKDGDNEMISFSSDEELMEALGCLEENVFRVYVNEKRKQNQGTAAGAEGEVFHPGVVCDGCEGSIRGPRFKCIVCPDYDLCKQCEEKGLHPEHEFVKFRKPGIGRTHQGGFKWRPNMWRGFGHPGWRHWWWSQQQGNQGPWGAHCRYQQQGENGEDQQQQGEGQQQQQQGGQQQQQQQGEEGARDFMQHVGEQVAELLDPLGIDVDIETSIGGMRRKCHGGRGGRGRGGYRGWTGGSGCPGRGKGKGKCRKMNQGDKQDDKETEEKQKDGEESTSTTTKAAEAMETEGGNSGAPGEGGSSGAPGEGGSSEAPGEGGSSGSSGSNEDGEWTMVTDDHSDGKGGQQGQSQNAENSDPDVASAVEQLQAMGFDDDDGWLTHLVEAKGGDINRVLDTIRLNQQQ